MADLVVVYWRDIPAQVIVKRGRREQHKEVLPERFEKAIDRAAMRGGAKDSDSYLSDWRKSAIYTVSDDLAVEALAKVAELVAEYDDTRLADLVRSGGKEN